MKQVTVYSGPGCPYCVQVKNILKKKGISFKEIDVRADPEKLAEMMEKTNGKKSIPQIVVDGKYVGDDDDLNEIIAANKFDDVFVENTASS